MDLRQFFDNYIAEDPSWDIARSITERYLRVTPHDWRLIRQSWQGQLTVKELLRMLGFTHFNVKALLRAAMADNSSSPSTPGANAEPPTIEQALTSLGVRYSILVLTVNYVATNTLRTKPPPLWKGLFKDMMTNVEIGYRFGSRASMLGHEGGALMGFALSVGRLLLMAHDGKVFAKLSREDKFEDANVQLEHFGCQDYQIASFVMQQLGFGTPIAIGTVLALGNLDVSRLDFGNNDEAFGWRAAVLWIRALKEGRNYPGDLKMRSFFPELTPPRDRGTPNRTLEVLYTELARVKSYGSSWTWHLPKGSYDDQV